MYYVTTFRTPAYIILTKMVVLTMTT